MGVYVYCIGAAGHPGPTAVRGIGGADVERLDTGRFTLWVSRLPKAPAPSLDAAREHNAVVERACDEQTALPLRFGQWLRDEAAVEELLRDRGDELTAGLDRVRGAMEMGIRVVDPEQEVAPPDRSSGKAYLETLARREERTRTARRRGSEIADELGGWLEGFVRARRDRPLGTAAGLVVVSCLVARHDIGSYNDRVREFPDRHPDLRFLFSGPWPPYGFADDGRQNAA